MRKFKFKLQGFAACAFLFVLAMVIVVCGYGYIENLVALAHSIFDPLTGVVVLRAIGIFVVPIGVIMGVFF